MLQYVLRPLLYTQDCTVHSGELCTQLNGELSVEVGLCSVPKSVVCTQLKCELTAAVGTQ